MPFDVVTVEAPPVQKPSQEKIAIWENHILNDSRKLSDKSFLFEWDDVSKCIKIGKASFDNYRIFKNFDAFCEHVLGEEGIHPPCYHPKWRSKWMAACLKQSPKRLYEHFNKMQYKYFVAPVSDILAKVHYRPGRIAATTVNQIRKHEAICREVFNDGLYNILPLVVASGKRPQELKKELGPAWKVLAKNSLNKNKAVLKCANRDSLRFLERYNEGAIAQRASLPTTVLNMFKGYEVEVLEHIAAHYKGKWNSKHTYKDGPPDPDKPWKLRQRIPTEKYVDWGTVWYTVRDTKRMAEQLDKPFNALWTPRKMKEKHDQYAKEVLKLKHSPEPIKWLEGLPASFEHEGYVATLLNNRYAIAEEGQAMGHCVGGYAPDVAAGRYLVYSVTKDGERSSTLGIDVRKPHTANEPAMRTVYSFNQHYGRWNKSLEDEVEQELGKMVVSELNKFETEKQK